MDNKIILDYFLNTAMFIKDEKHIFIKVDMSQEVFSIYDLIEDELTELYDIPPEEKGEDTDSLIADLIEKQNALLSVFKSKYAIDTGKRDDYNEIFYRENPHIERDSFNNILSGAWVNLYYGQGIIDFLYADFETPTGEAFQSHKFKEKLFYSTDFDSDDELVIKYQDFCGTMALIKNVAYQSIYTTICPPLFLRHLDKGRAIVAYFGYLQSLQKYYLDLLEFCFDETFHPEVLSSLYPSERFFLYRSIHDMPTFTNRKEQLKFSTLEKNGDEMPYGLPASEVVKRMGERRAPTDAEIKFAELYNVDPSYLSTALRMPHFINIEYHFGSVADILELEFTKLLEQNIRFRKCKRCGRYFIMKGNYDTNYCDRIADGETRNCQELSAQENYKAKIADNQAIPLYSKFYKRYSARVKARQIKEADFKKWKYQALTKRDECSDGKISVEEYEQWLTDSFPNRAPKK